APPGASKSLPRKRPRILPVYAPEKQTVPKKGGYVSQALQPNLLCPFQHYFYGGDVPRVLAFTDNLRAQVHMLYKAALDEAVIHHLSHINSRADGSSTSL